MDLREKILKRIASFSFRSRRLVLLVSAITFLASLFLILGAEFESDVSKLIPRDAEITNTYFRFLKDFGGIDRLLIVFEKEDGDILDDVSLIENFATQLKSSAIIGDVEYMAGAEMKRYFEDVFSRKALLLLSEDDITLFEKRFKPEAIKEEIERTRERLLSPMGSAAKEMILMDPLNLSVILRKYLMPQSGMKMDLSSGYYVSEDRTMLLMIVKPKGSAQDIKFDRKLIKEVNEIEGRVRQSFPDTPLHIGYTGGYIIALRDAEIIKSDIIRNTLTSSFGVILIFIFFFRGIGKIIYPAVPFILSLVWTLSISYPMLGHLSDVTGAFSALLIGLGIDLVIIIYNRYIFERSEGVEPSQAIEMAAGKTGLGILTGVITTVASFYSLSISKFPGIRELGFLTGTGMIFFAIAVFFMIPALLSTGWVPEKRTGKIRSIGIEKIALISYRNPYITLILISLITIVLLPYAIRLNINNDLKTLRPSGNPAAVLNERVGEKIGGMNAIIVTADAGSLEELLFINEKVEEKIHSLKAEGIPIRAADSLSRLLPSEERQERNLKIDFDVEKIDIAISNGLNEYGFRQDAFKEFRERLKVMLSNSERITIDEIRASGMARAIERYIKEEDNTFRSVIYCYPEKNGWDKKETEIFLKSLKAVAPSVKVSGSGLIREELTEILTKDIVLITMISFMLIAILLYADFRRIGITFICLLPLILGIIWMLGTMPLLGVELNFMNSIAAALILGVGIDYSIHLIHRYLEGGGMMMAVDQTGRGIVVAAITTMVGFGSIILSDFPGLSSMGAVTLLGVGYCLLLTLTLLPATIRIYEKVRRDA